MTFHILHIPQRCSDKVALRGVVMRYLNRDLLTSKAMNLPAKFCSISPLLPNLSICHETTRTDFQSSMTSERFINLLSKVLLACKIAPLWRKHSRNRGRMTSFCYSDYWSLSQGDDRENLISHSSSPWIIEVFNDVRLSEILLEVNSQLIPSSGYHYYREPPWELITLSRGLTGLFQEPLDGHLQLKTVLMSCSEEKKYFNSLF